MNIPPGAPNPEESVKQTESVLQPTAGVPKIKLNIGSAKSLTELMPDYVFFTPAILYLYGGFCDAPLADFTQHNPGVEFYYYKFDRAMFSGLHARSNGDNAWNYALWAVRRVYWEPLLSWLVGTVLTYAEERNVARIGEQQLHVCDPLNVLAINACIPVTGFGLYGSRYIVGLSLHDRVPKLVVQQGAPEMKKIADALFNQDNLYGVLR